MGFRFVGPTKPIAVAIALIVGGATDSFGFIPTTISGKKLPHPQHQGLSRSILPSPSSALPALVYGADGKVVGDDVFDNPDETAKAMQASQDNDASLLESLKTSVGDPIVWSKIACAFAPPPHNKLTPETVRDAVPVGLSTGAIDIAVAVPASVEGGAANAAANQLVRVLVRVGFLQAWVVDGNSSTNNNNSETVTALVEQVKILEAHAEDLLSQRISSGPSKDDPGYYENLVIEQRRLERLQEEPSFSEKEDLPDWWISITPPFSSLELVDEAKLLKGLLNEDEFEDDLRALFVRESGNSESKDNSLVLRAAVASIGSSGLFLKARVATVQNNESENDEAEIVATATIPYGNPPMETKTVGELRDGVLTLVESVVPMPMPVRPQATAVSKEESGDETITPFNEQVMEMVNKLDEKTATISDGVVEKNAEKESSETEEDDVDLEEVKTITPEKSSMVSEISPGASRTQQPRPPDEEAKLAAKYAAIENLGERAFAILRDLGMV